MNEIVKRDGSLKSLVTSDSIKKRFEDLLDKEANGFITTLLSINKGKLAQCDPMTILGAALKAAALKLPVDPNFGYAWIIPYKNKGKDEAQFQLGAKGYVQLAQRSGEYLRINVTEIFKGQYKGYNALTEELTLDMEAKESDEVVGYAAFFKLRNGFEKQIYWEKDKVEKHAKRFSKSYNRPDSIWKSDFDAMAKKTVLKHLLSQWGILSTEMRTAVNADSAVIRNNGEHETITYADNEPDGIEIPDPFADAMVADFEEVLDDPGQQ